MPIYTRPDHCELPMPHLNGIAAAGMAEATRIAQTVIHRGAEAGIVVVTGEKADRAHAERIPEAGAGAPIARRPQRERNPRERRERHERREDLTEDETGSLIDLQA